MYPTKLPTKIKKTCVPTSDGVTCKHLFSTKMWLEDDIAITGAACVILSLEYKKRKKKVYWICPSILTKKQYSGSDLMIDLNVLTLIYLEN
ncbi:unnamed protein product [Macrosiphum euphorbiae]|uniref:Uncharacterized protein n=1 Tax=Macrosiphum euphorbiae TaxID=13131 RepID=A0AAV0WHJ5_9HEMI|nr:unnamed protein product [Macrosiphum euphorbiae]